MSRRWAFLLTLLLAPSALAGPPGCDSVLVDTSRPLEERRALALQCLQSNCRDEARELALEPDAVDRFMAMCTRDQSDVVSADTTGTGNEDGVDGLAKSIACARGEGCTDIETGLEATATGLGRAGTSDAGHTFVRVQRINEVIER